MNNAPASDDVSDELSEDAEWIMPSEAVTQYGIARRTVYNWIKDGAVAARVVVRGRQRHYQVRRDDLERLVHERIESLETHGDE